MKAVMKEEDQYSAFTDLCCDIYNILREHSALLVRNIAQPDLRQSNLTYTMYLVRYHYSH